MRTGTIVRECGNEASLASKRQVNGLVAFGDKNVYVSSCLKLNVINFEQLLIHLQLWYTLFVVFSPFLRAKTAHRREARRRRGFRRAGAAGLGIGRR